MPRDFREYIVGLLSEPDPAAQDFIRNPRPYPGQQGAPAAAPLTPPDWARTNRSPGPQGGRLPRLSEIGPLLRTQAAPVAPRGYRPPRMVVGPGGLTGERPAARVSLSQVALPSFLPNPVAPPQGGPEAPLSPFRFEPGAGQPAVTQPQGQDDLDAAWAAAIQRVRAAQAAPRPRKRSR